MFENTFILNSYHIQYFNAIIMDFFRKHKAKTSVASITPLKWHRDAPLGGHHSPGGNFSTIVTASSAQVTKNVDNCFSSGSLVEGPAERFMDQCDAQNGPAVQQLFRLLSITFNRKGQCSFVSLVSSCSAMKRPWKKYCPVILPFCWTIFLQYDPCTQLYRSKIPLPIEISGSFATVELST